METLKSIQIIFRLLFEHRQIVMSILFLICAITGIIFNIYATAFVRKNYIINTKNNANKKDNIRNIGKQSSFINHNARKNN